MTDDRKHRHKKQHARERSAAPHISITSVVVVRSPASDDEAAVVSESERRRRDRLRRRPLFGRLFPSLDRRANRWIRRAVRTGLLALGTVLASVLQYGSIADADELIEQASQAERATPPAATALVALTFVRQDTGESVRLVQQVGASPTLPHKAPPDGVPSAFRSALTSIGFNWQRPLGISAVALFRTSHLRDRSERVTRRTKDDVFVLTTTVPTGALREAQVSVDAESYRVVRELLTFPGIGTLDIEDLTHPTHSTAADLPAPRLPAPPALPTRDELDRAELRVRLVLADTGADLDSRVQISRTPDSVHVQADAGAAHWNSQTNAQLRALAYVQLELRTAPAGTEAVPAVSSATKFGLARWRERRFGYPAARDPVLPNLMESLVAVRQRLAVLEDLAKRYPSPKRELSNEARALLARVTDRHYQRLRAELTDTKTGIFGLFDSVVLRQERAIASADLLPHARVAASRARTLEKVVRTVAAQDDLTPEDQQRIKGAFSALWESVHGSAPLRVPDPYATVNQRAQRGS